MKSDMKYFIVCSLFVFLILIPFSAVYAEKLIPDWVKNNFLWFAEDQISETEIINAIKFLIEQKIIILQETDDRSLDDTAGKTIPKTSCDVTVHEKADYTILIYMVASDLEEKKWQFAKMVVCSDEKKKNGIVKRNGKKKKNDSLQR